MPKVIHAIREMQETALELRRAGKRLGLVPTMGALHEGHLSLVRKAKAECDVSIATIFVNPAQFGPQEDFGKYPRTLDADLAALESVGCDYAFLPSAEEMYPPGFSTYVAPPEVAAPLEGILRPGHFRGVCTVVLKLFQIAPSDVGYFGQKDYQQARVIGHMVRDLNVPLRIAVGEIVRDDDGLALSSRNRYLSVEERRQAAALFHGLQEAKSLLLNGVREAESLRQAMRRVLAEHGIERIDYATIADADSLAEVARVERPAVALIACYAGTTRLIDNVILSPP